MIRDSCQPSYDKLIKVRWLVEVFLKRSRELYNPGEFLAVDECVIPYEGMYCKVRQFSETNP
jgi:hypothetical protein